MTTIDQLASGLGTAVGNAGIRYLPYLGDQVNPPVALVAIDEVPDYHVTAGAVIGGGLSQYHFIVYVIVSRANERAGLVAMEQLMSVGKGGLPYAIEIDPTLDGIADTLIVEKSGPVASITVGGVPYISVPFDVQVFA